MPASQADGSSPRGRGTHATIRCRLLFWTGHPRVGGEHLGFGGGMASRSGSSPRGRGTRGVAQDGHSPRRVIPAWAGNTSSRARSGIRAGHPRVGGEHGVWYFEGNIYAGSSPRGRGTLHFVPHPHSVFPHGSSPRGRGTHCCRDATGIAEHVRVIPAWAGNTVAPSMLQSFSHQPGHPRVGGEHGGSGMAAMHAGRVIPAWAGNTRRAAV